SRDHNLASAGLWSTEAFAVRFMCWLGRCSGNFRIASLGLEGDTLNIPVATRAIEPLTVRSCPMLQFKVGDRVRVSPLALENCCSSGRIVEVREHDAGALRLQECEIDLGSHSHSCLSLHLQHAHEPVRLFCGEVLSKWPHLSVDDVRNSGGDMCRLVELLQRTYEYSQDRAERELDLVLNEFNEKILRAA